MIIMDREFFLVKMFLNRFGNEIVFLRGVLYRGFGCYENEDVRNKVYFFFYKERLVFDIL